MSKEVYIFDATEANFEQVVLHNSNTIPVVIVFMGSWSEPCYVLSEIFSKLAKEFAGQFIFAKIDIDEQPGLRDQYDVKNIPTTIVIQNGNAAFASEGLLTEVEARVILKGVNVFDVIDDMREQARKKHINGETQDAIILLSKAIQQSPGNTHVALDMVQIFIDIKEFEQANGLFNKLPDAAKQNEMGQSITGQLTFVNLAAEKQSVETLQNILFKDENDKQARFDLAVCLTAEYEYEQAMEHLLTLHQQDDQFQGGAARELAITIIRMLKATQPEVAGRAQQQLSNILMQ